jgi:hypothetical protein
LLYDFSLNRTVEISRLARILGQLDSPASTQELVNRAAQMAKEPISVVEAAITTAVVLAPV